MEMLNSHVKDFRAGLLVVCGAIGTGLLAAPVQRLPLPEVIKDLLPLGVAIGAASVFVKKADLKFVIFGSLAHLAMEIMLKPIQPPLLPSIPTQGTVIAR